jgi:heme-degrading monooxygenase HmoA
MEIPMISRHWKGVAKREHAEEYVAHLESRTFPELAALPGFRRASILRREVPSGTEFQIVTEWESLESIRGFAGAEIERAVVPESVRAMMVDYDTSVTHYQVVGRFPVKTSADDRTG